MVSLPKIINITALLDPLAQILVISVFQYRYPAYAYRISREEKGRIHRLENAVVLFAFNLRLNDHVYLSREDANMLSWKTYAG